jgi:hypothetical protein
MHTHITSIPLLIVIIIITANIGTITNTSITNPYQLAYAHNFVPAIAASFLTRINQIRVQVQLVEDDIPLNLSLAKQHAEIASELFDNNTQNDLYYNAEGNNGLAQKISGDIPLALSNLQKTVVGISTKTTTATTTASSSSLLIGQSEPLLQSQQQQQTTSSNNNTAIKQIKEMVNNINDILDKAVSVRIDKYDLTNSTVHALVLADITEKAYNDYSYAYGIKPVMFSGSSSSSMMMNMGSGMGMMMTTMSSGPNASSNSSTNSSAKSRISITNDNEKDNSSTVVNTTAYQQAQGLAMRAQEIFSNDLKPTSSVTNSLLSSPHASSFLASSNSNSNITSATINRIENNLILLKNAIDSKAPVMDVMKIVHGDIHPSLLISYDLQLRR